MIRCLQCEFENPDTHRFCQNCGAVLQRAGDHRTDVQTSGDKTVEKEEARQLYRAVVDEVPLDRTSRTDTSEHQPDEVPDDRVSRAELANMPSTVTSGVDTLPPENNLSEQPTSTTQLEPSLSKAPLEPTAQDVFESETLNEPDEDRQVTDMGHPAEFASSVSLTEESPPWLAILSLNDPLDAEFFDPSVVDLAAITDVLQKQAIALQERGYLDTHQRYRISECSLKTPEIQESVIAPYLEITLFDDKPDELSQLDLLLNQRPVDASHQSREEDLRDVSDSELPVHDSLESHSSEGESSQSGSPESPMPGFSSSTSDGSESSESESDESEFIEVDPATSQSENPSADSLEDSSGGSDVDISESSPEINTPMEHGPGEEREGDEVESDRLPENATVLEARRAASALESAQAIASFTPSGRSVKSSKIPGLAAVYLTVQDEFYPSLPQIHDAWMTENVSVIIVENRNVLQGLDEAIQMPQTTPLQVLHWLHEMTELWAVLQPKHYHQSLLDLENLHVDEDQILCITCLYRPSKHTDISLSALGQLWQQLLHGSPLKTNDDLNHLTQKLATKQIASIDDLRFQLEEVAMRLNDECLAMAGVVGTDASVSSRVNESDLDAISQSSGLSTDRLTPSDDALAEELGMVPEGDEAPTVVLPMRLFHLTDVGATDIGRQRDHNEDYFSVQSEMWKKDTPVGRKLSARGLYILCDGMGGHAAGEVASALAVSTLESYFTEHWTDRFPTQDEIRDGIRKANNSIYELNQENACYGSGRMGTTLVMMLVDDIKVAIAHVGDSRVYKFCRRTGLEQITVDHEVGQREIQRGVEPAIAYARPDAYQLTQALGPRDSEYISPGIQALEVTEDTLFLLCSDGLSDNNLLEQFCDTHVEPMLSSQANLSQELTNLIDLANQHNGHDNITAIAVRMKVRPKVQGLR